jgi:hypothetical protein
MNRNDSLYSDDYIEEIATKNEYEPKIEDIESRIDEFQSSQEEKTTHYKVAKAYRTVIKGIVTA